MVAGAEGDLLTYNLIGLAMAAHSELSPGLDEICYHESLSARMELDSIAHEFKPRLELVHRGFVADRFEADLVVPSQVVLEAKHLRDGFAAQHFAQLHCYLKAWKIETGLLFDFGKQSLIVRRRKISLTMPCLPKRNELSHRLQTQGLDLPDARLLSACLDRILREHGLGYWDTTYRGLIRADLNAERVAVLDRPEVEVATGRAHKRRVRLECLVIEGRLALQVLALRASIPAAAKAILAAYLRHLGLRSGVTINFGKQTVDLDVRVL